MAMQSSSLPPLDVQRAPEGGEVGAVQSGWRLALREFTSNRLAVIGFAILIFFVLFCYVGPLIYHTNQTGHSNPQRRHPPALGHGHPLGTDDRSASTSSAGSCTAARSALEIGVRSPRSSPS